MIILHKHLLDGYDAEIEIPRKMKFDEFKAAKAKLLSDDGG